MGCLLTRDAGRVSGIFVLAPGTTCNTAFAGKRESYNTAMKTESVA